MIPLVLPKPLCFKYIINGSNILSCLALERSKQSGFRQLHIIIKLANGTWLISDVFDSFSNDWRISEFNIADIKWMTLDIETITEKSWVENPDLSKVEEIGWTDLMKGGGSKASSRLDWIEVDGYSVDK